jgi:hypothetical protein
VRPGSGVMSMRSTSPDDAPGRDPGQDHERAPGTHTGSSRNLARNGGDRSIEPAAML